MVGAPGRHLWSAKVGDQQVSTDAVRSGELHGVLWRGYLAANADALRREINEKLVRTLSRPEKCDDKRCQAMAGLRKQTHIGPRIDVLLNSEEGNLIGRQPVA
jgi:hypothetical protein